jgi:hypothetical protein
MSNYEQVQNVLNQISTISQQFEKIAELTGENFNVFRVLGLSTHEVRTHSAFLCELLNPKGKHGYKDVFLKLFLAQQKEKQKEKEAFLTRFSAVDTTNSTASPESYIGFINDAGTEGGRIDILIKDNKNNAIIIENKINARDQPFQLVRYNNAYPKAPIFYLTLDLSNPSENSKGNLIEDIDYVCITYKEDIKYWLEKCKEKAVNHAILRETIAQYINLIKYLTGQTINDNMTQEIVKKIARNAENIEASILVATSIESLKSHLLCVLKSQLKEIDKTLNVDFGVDDARFENREADGAVFFNPKEWINFRIGFCFESKSSNDLFYGICHKEFKSGTEEEIKQIQDAIKETPDADNDCKYSYWHWLKYFGEPYKNWGIPNNSKPWSEIANGEMKKKIEEKIKDILNKTQGKDWF